MPPNGVNMHRIGYFLTDGFQVMALGTQSVFEFANVVAKEEIYQVTNYSLLGRGQIIGRRFNQYAAGKFRGTRRYVDDIRDCQSARR